MAEDSNMCLLMVIEKGEHSQLGLVERGNHDMRDRSLGHSCERLPRKEYKEIIQNLFSWEN